MPNIIVNSNRKHFFMTHMNGKMNCKLELCKILNPLYLCSKPNITIETMW